MLAPSWATRLGAEEATTWFGASAVRSCSYVIRLHLSVHQAIKGGREHQKMREVGATRRFAGSLDDNA